jgi:hypothetical protein
MIVYEPGAGVIFGLGGSGLAQVSDGAKAMGLNDFAQSATISFAAPVDSFGAYWGAGTATTPTTVSLLYSDRSTASFSYLRPDDGVLEWHGWSSSVGISGVTYSGDFVVIDGLQAGGTASVPDAASTSALLFIALGVLEGLRRKLKCTVALHVVPLR